MGAETDQADAESVLALEVEALRERCASLQEALTAEKARHLDLMQQHGRMQDCFRAVLERLRTGLIGQACDFWSWNRAAGHTILIVRGVTSWIQSTAAHDRDARVLIGTASGGHSRVIMDEILKDLNEPERQDARRMVRFVHPETLDNFRGVSSCPLVLDHYAITHELHAIEKAARGER